MKGLALSREGAGNKVRVDINVSAETKRQLDGIIDIELQDDRENDRPERSKSEVLEMIMRKGIHVWQEARACGQSRKLSITERPMPTTNHHA
jgi:hypothetical protein